MAKTASKRKTNESIVVPQQPDFGKTIPVKVKRTMENWSSYRLEDGTTLEVRPVVIEIERSLSKYNQQGEPIYLIRHGVAIKTKVPPKLKIKRKPK